MSTSPFRVGNKIEHRLFSHISQNWRGKLLISHEVIVNLISATTTKAGLGVRCQLDMQSYPKGPVVSDDELTQVHLLLDDLHGEWNYIISPRTGQVDTPISRRLPSLQPKTRHVEAYLAGLDIHSGDRKALLAVETIAAAELLQ